MPTNLNALIRYKTINNCLSTGRGFTIEELMEECSKALGEYRGKYSGVSERTLRDDLRVMKGEILGINAPIVQRGGKYFYSDRNYQLNNTIFTDNGVIQKAIKLLNDLFEKTSDPEIEDMIHQLQRVIVRSAPGKIIAREEYFEDRLEHGLPGMHQYIEFDRIRAPRKPRVPKPAAPTWGDLFRVMMKVK